MLRVHAAGYACQLADETNYPLWRASWRLSRAWILAIVSTTAYIVWNHVANIQATSATLATLVEQNKLLLFSLIDKLEWRAPTVWDAVCACVWLARNEPPHWDTPYEIAQRYVTPDALPDTPWWAPVSTFVERIGWADTTRAQESARLWMMQQVLVVQRFQSETDALFRSAQSAVLTTLLGVVLSIALWSAVATYTWWFAPSVSATAVLPAPRSPRRKRNSRSRKRRKKRSNRK